MNQETKEEKINTFMERCREMGIRVTPQRVAVFRELAATSEHPAAQTVYERVKREMPSISLDTVYRTLSRLEAEGIVANVGTTEGTVRYDARTEPHYHFVCRQCNRVIDVPSEDKDAFEPPETATEHGRVEAVNIQLRGCCSACLEQNREQSS